ncbi:hypothetical protein MCOR25_007370 [Pyricularia grisea]|uniref:Uncharacterized protein n=1 Tax=Pyricularia grisea TaxID=148305 RepID=A0A6P8BFE8_PYRGI|nr:uncharacterized protein PgNI_00151 [Pyricularia grisea]KAI6358272.1 hypothetical protein MCOR25_007370 [Pyricularia grisea]TLD15440.1 hypothetical protein PgNI_00151 [Pyricularia grisea]
MQFSTILSLVYLGAGTAVLAAGIPGIQARGAIPFCQSNYPGNNCQSTEFCEQTCGGASKTSGCSSTCVCVCSDGTRN